jgi:MFS family permease
MAPLAATSRAAIGLDDRPDAIPQRNSWYLLGVLTVLLVLAMIDRLSLSLLVEPVKRELAIDDSRMSLLLGASFALLYTAAGLPAGYLVDRFNRRWLLLGGTLLWTGMTFCSAFAPSFGALFFFRAGVGLGEAVLSPAIYSMIRDAFPARRRPLAYGINNIGSPLGTGAALLLIGRLSGVLSPERIAAFPMLAELSPWRLVLAAVGLGGIPLALLLFTVREPTRPAAVTVNAMGDEASVRAVWAHFTRSASVYVPLFASTAFYGVGLNGLLAWIPTALIRSFGVTASLVGQTLGGIQLVAAPVGLAVAGGTLSFLARRQLSATAPIIGGTALVGCAAAIGAWSFTFTLEDGWLALAVLLFLAPWSGVTIATLLAQVTPSRMMGKIAAVNFLMLGLVGMVAGPTLNPFLASHLFTGRYALAHGVMLGSGVGFLASGLSLMTAGIAMARRGLFARGAFMEV